MTPKSSQFASERNFFEKRLGPRERREPEAIARLRSEATLLGLLSGTGVTPRLLERGEDEQGPWHRIERIDLPTLASRIAEGATIDNDWIERAMKNAFRALCTLHEASDANGIALEIVHADISPANIAIDDTGDRVVVLDFDLAWWRDGPPRNDGAFRGTIGYVAPEVARGERPTVRSDLFALAASFLHAALGSSPRIVNDDDPFAAVLMRAAELPLIDADRGPDWDKTIAARGPMHGVMIACLSHEPADRFISARAVLDRSTVQLP